MVTIDEYLSAARQRLDRVQPEDLAREVVAGAILVDVRDTAQRQRQGELPGAIIDLTVLEWRLAPSSNQRTIDIEPDQRVILVCRDGYSSSLAAARLQELGVAGATDLVGGYAAWGDAGVNSPPGD